MAVQPLSPATNRSLGRPLPYQLTNRTRVRLTPAEAFPAIMMPCLHICGISTGFPVLSPSIRLVTHALLTRSPLSASIISPKKSCESFSFDLHVLSTPPALILSQDQTLEKNIFSNLTIQNSGSKFTLDLPSSQTACVRPKPSTCRFIKNRRVPHYKVHCSIFKVHCLYR